MSTQAKLLEDVPVIDIGADTPVLALDSSGAVGKGTLAAQFDLYFTLGITGRVSHQVRGFNVSYNDVLNWLDEEQNNWGGVFPKGLQYVIWEIHTFEGIALLYEKVKSYADSKIFTSPILAKIPGKPWRWSKNVTESNSGGVISCTAIGPYLVAYKEKGGSHEHICEEYGRSADKFQSDISVGADRGAGHKRGCVGVLESVALSAKGGFEHAYRNGTVSDYHGVICEFPVCGSRIHGAGISVRADKYRSDSDIRYVGHGNVHPQVQVRQLDSVGYIHYNKSANLITRKEVVAA